MSWRYSRDSPVSWSRTAAAMKALMAVLERVACAALASMTRLTLALASRASAKVRERVRRAMASPKPGDDGMDLDLVRDATGGSVRVCGGAKVSGTLGAVAGTTLGAGVGFLGGTTLGDGDGDLEGEGEGSTLGACAGEGRTASGDASSFHLC